MNIEFTQTKNKTIKKNLNVSKIIYTGKHKYKLKSVNK